MLKSGEAQTLDSQDVLTFDEAMAYLRVKRTTMYKLIQLPDGPEFVGIGSKRIITRKSLHDWVTRHEGDRMY